MTSILSIANETTKLQVGKLTIVCANIAKLIEVTYTANGANQRKIGGPSSSAIFIDIGYVKMGTRRRLHKMY